MDLVQEFVTAFGVWEEARPFVHLMVDQDVMRLVLSLQAGALTTEEVASELRLSPGAGADLVKRAYQCHAVDRQVRDGAEVYLPGTFYELLNHVAKHGRWDEIPAADRQVIDRRFLDAFIARHRKNVEHRMQGREADGPLPNDAVMLLPEVEEMIDAARLIVVQPCDCRRLGQNCERPVETCIFMDDLARGALDRGYGRELSHQEAKELLRWADRRGLMHTSDNEWRTHGLHAICNCCACDCYPFRAGQELGSKGIWPKSRYVAVYNQQACNLCGACVQRCHFDAFYRDGSIVQHQGKTKEIIRYDPDRCWGCGLCANTCPSGAIIMSPLSLGECKRETVSQVP
jgi:NAD-dependent dihydropyrimidine dehydrogenase PreA subunit